MLCCDLGGSQGFFSLAGVTKGTTGWSSSLPCAGGGPPICIETRSGGNKWRRSSEKRGIPLPQVCNRSTSRKLMRGGSESVVSTSSTRTAPSARMSRGDFERHDSVCTHFLLLLLVCGISCDLRVNLALAPGTSLFLLSRSSRLSNLLPFECSQPALLIPRCDVTVPLSSPLLTLGTPSVVTRSFTLSVSLSVSPCVSQPDVLFFPASDHFPCVRFCLKLFVHVVWCDGGVLWRAVDVLVVFRPSFTRFEGYVQPVLLNLNALSRKVHRVWQVGEQNIEWRPRCDKEHPAEFHDSATRIFRPQVQW